MAILKQPKSPEDVKKMTPTMVKKEYNDLAESVNDMYEYKTLLCPRCGEWGRDARSYYFDPRYATSRLPICKKCIQEIVEDKKNKNGESRESKESVKRALRIMDRPYVDKLYESCCKKVADSAMSSTLKQSPFSAYVAAIISLPQYNNPIKSWDDSEFGEGNYNASGIEIHIDKELLGAAKKRFGEGYSDEDYTFLENEYQDWITRYECNTKAQEEVFENLSVIKLLKKKAILSGDSTKDLDKQQQDWMDAGKLKPKQSNMDNLTDAQSLGTLLQKWEETKPLPDVDPELQDVDKIGLYIDVFFKGHTSKMMGIKNTFSHIYEKFMGKYSVKPPEYDEELDSEDIFEKIFGSAEEV